MIVTHPRTAELHDPALPAVHLLLAEGVPDAVAAVFAEVAIVVDEAIVRQVTWWPGRSIVVHYRARFSGALKGSHQIVASAGDIPEGAVVAEGEGTRIGVWRVPHDPALPGLPAALDPRTARQLVRDLGIPDGEVTTELRAYRPGRRAVVEVRGERTLVYLKLVRPGEVEELHRRHEFLEGLMPVPRSLGFEPALGVLALQPLPGITLRRALESPEVPLPPPGELEALLLHLPVVADAPMSRSPIERLPALAGLLSRIVPGEKSRIEALVGRIGTETGPPSVATHGDFYEAQVLVAQGRITGVLDIDTFGLGRPADDPATMIGHLAALQVASRQPERVRTFASSLLRGWDRRVDPVDLRTRAAAVIASLATGPFRVQSATWPEDVRRRLSLAERWVESAYAIDKRNLTDASGKLQDPPPS